MKSRWIGILLTVVVIGALSLLPGCTGGGNGGSLDGVGGAGGGSNGNETAVIPTVVKNSGTAAVVEVHGRTSESEQWGENLIRQKVLPGGEISITCPACTSYNVVFEDGAATGGLVDSELGANGPTKTMITVSNVAVPTTTTGDERP